MVKTRVAVLGAGLQGACIALELAGRGAQVDLVEQDALAVNRASARNEGKIHLGFVYAKDETLRTARLMVRGALAFRPLLSRWTGGAFDRLAPSAPFHYLVPYDSAWSPADLAHHYAAVQEIYAEERRAGGDYLGGRPEQIWRRMVAEEYADVAPASRVQAGFATAEASIPVRQTAAIVRAALAAHPGIALRTGHRVRSVAPGPAGFRVEGSVAGAPWRLDCDQVVNALWDGRLAVDAALGIRPPRPWVHRLKYRVLVELPARLRGMPSCTFVLGPYGDIVRYADGEEAYVSWYPRCLQGWSDDLAPPTDWERACAGTLPAATQAAVGASALQGFDTLVPGLAGARILAVDAGVIFAWGHTDITDPRSELHRRHDTGVLSRDGYHSVNTGKLTTAPLFAVEAADRVLGGRHSPRSAVAAPAVGPRSAGPP